MSLGQFQVPPPHNEPNLTYAPGTDERRRLKAELERVAKTQVKIPVRVGGKRIETSRTSQVVMPHDHQHVLGTMCKAGKEEVNAAIEAAQAAKPGWVAMPFEERVGIFLRAAHLLRGKYREAINAVTMLGQSKTAHQAEIDAACELIDFLNFNVHFLRKIMEEQPRSVDGLWNRVEYRPLDGFVLAITPFNFTAIGGNLPTAPAMCGNTVLWKPSTTAILSSHLFMDVLEEAGLPPGVINFLPGDGRDVGDPALDSPHFAGLHFTGSTRTFQTLWKGISDRLDQYKQYPRIVGETGGKDFVVAHPSALVEPLVVALLRGAFEYQGQKCSAASRAYIPSNLWPEVERRLTEEIPKIKMGDVTDFRNFMGAVIDEKAFEKITGAIDEAKQNLGKSVTKIIGGEYDREKGWFIRPTVIVTSDPKYRTMEEELFGPVLTIYVYDETKFSDTLKLCDETSPYGLTGGVFSQDKAAVAEATDRLRFAAGNFYVNDKPTGSIVGQQPFGGSRYSGTNDKAGSMWNIIRWLSPRAIKETFDPPTDWRYPFMDEE